MYIFLQGLESTNTCVRIHNMLFLNLSIIREIRRKIREKSGKNQGICVFNIGRHPELACRCRHFYYVNNTGGKAGFWDKAVFVLRILMAREFI